MNRIYKYPLSLASGPQSITLPQDAEIVYFDMQDGTPCIWARVEPFGTVQRVRHFWIIGTGFDIKDNLKHVGTALHGAFVWHLFEQE